MLHLDCPDTFQADVVLRSGRIVHAVVPRMRQQFDALFDRPSDHGGETGREAGMLEQLAGFPQGDTVRCAHAPDRLTGAGSPSRCLPAHTLLSGLRRLARCCV